MALEKCLFHMTMSKDKPIAIITSEQQEWCLRCEETEENKSCKYYVPCTMYEFDVKNK